MWLLFPVFFLKVGEELSMYNLYFLCVYLLKRWWIRDNNAFTFYDKCVLQQSWEKLKLKA